MSVGKYEINEIAWHILSRIPQKELEEEHILLTKSLIFYIFEACNPEEWTGRSLLKLLVNIKVFSDGRKDAIDFLMEDLDIEDPDSEAVKYYTFYKKRCSKNALRKYEKDCVYAAAPFFEESFDEIVKDFEHQDGAMPQSKFEKMTQKLEKEINQ